ncbi:MAG: S-methyl-5-thioribose-1-phosphate isomerase [Arenicella sp.]|nr:S-methyl-5-thioribose-1-phosphate isomerase [Arenicella sp.]
MRKITPIEFIDSSAVRLLDQRMLPADVVYNNYSNIESLSQAITDMVVRGAPAIGITVAYGLALAAFNAKSNDISVVKQAVQDADSYLRKSRPTAVNLFWALDQVHAAVPEGITDAADYCKAIESAVDTLAVLDIETNKAIGYHAMAVVPDDVTFIHHCNTGSLATMEYGTALGIIRIAHEEGKKVNVFVDETRPRLQGSKLTSWELKELGIDHRVIVDGASGHVMSTQNVDMCVVGCDRVAMNGDVANKIGTYNLAIVAKEHGVPFYVAAPTSTIDQGTAKGGDIAVEERAAQEITMIGSERIAPEGIDVFNPAFDITPAKFISGIITEKGIVYPPYEEGLAALFKS